MLFGWRSNKINSIMQFLLSLKHPFELVHTKMCKNTPGVHRNASDSDLMAKSELGRFPLMSNIVKGICSYWQHVPKEEPNSLLSLTHKTLIIDAIKGLTNYYVRYTAIDPLKRRLTISS